MKRTSTTIKEWLHFATPDQARAVAKEAGTSVAHLRHVAHGRRRMSADLAQRLAAASMILHKSALRLSQRDLCAACQRCPLAN